MTKAMSDTPLPVLIYSDVICPWCYVGKRRFEAGLAGADLATPTAVSWRPFELNPDMPPEGIARADYRARKFGAVKSAQLDAQMMETGAELGIRFDFVKQVRTPSTRLAHRLIWAAGQQGDGRQNAAQNALVDRLFAGYFEQGQDIGRRDVLEAMAKDAGLNAKTTKSALDDDNSLSAVLSLEEWGVNAGIQGVPFFILAGKYAISGAQPADMWVRALPEIVAEAAKA
jgi:predicted DsbA family dithiol-disulfide isomerase